MIRPPYDGVVQFRQPWWPILPALALGVVMTIWTVRAAMAISGGALVYGADDAYIEMSLARTLAGQGVWGVTPDAFAGVGTSLAWPVLLAAAFRLSVAEWWPLALAAAASLGVVLVSAVMLRRYVSPSWQVLVLVGVTGGVSLSALTMLGMEHPLQMVAAIALAHMAARLLAAGTPAPGAREVLQLGCLAALAVAVRYDTAALVCGVAGVAVVRGHWRMAAGVVAGALLPALIYAAVAGSHGWPLIPVTLAKTPVAQMDLHAVSGWWFLLVRGPLGTLWRAPYLLVLMAAAAMMLARRPATWHAAGGRECRVLLCLFLIAAVAQLLFGLPAAYGDYRYDAWIVGLGVVATGAAAGLGGWPRRGPAWIAVILVAAPLTLHGVALVRQSLENVRRHFNAGHQVGLFLRDAGLPSYPAVHELGAVSWLTARPVLDLEGLATPDVRIAAETGDWTPARFSALAAALGTRVAAAFGVDDEPFPSSWRRVGEWWADGKLQYAFLAADTQAASDLRRALEAFDARLPGGVTRVDGGW